MPHEALNGSFIHSADKRGLHSLHAEDNLVEVTAVDQLETCHQSKIRDSGVQIGGRIKCYQRTR